MKALSCVRPGYFLLTIRAKPGAKSSGFVSAALDAEAVEVRIGAPPVEGAANAEVVGFFSEALDHAHRHRVHAQAATADASLDDPIHSVEEHGDASRKYHRQKQGGSNSAGTSSAHKPVTSALPTRVKVGLHGGSTSRNKVLALELPCATITEAWSLITDAADLF